jgi:hypothetical protein
MIAVKNFGKQRTSSFFCAKYRNMEFLFMEEQFESCEALQVEKRIKSPIPYISSATRYRGIIVPVFDLDSYLMTVFGAQSNGDAYRLLFIDFRTISKERQESVRKLKLKSGTGQEELLHLGIKLTCASEIITLERHEMRILPTLMNEIQEKRGILGLRFLDDGKIQYVLDYEVILLNVIARSNEETATHKAPAIADKTA